MIMNSYFVIVGQEVNYSLSLTTFRKVWSEKRWALGYRACMFFLNTPA